MKTNLIAAAVLTVLTGAASAQSSVQLMGTADVYAGSLRMSGDAGRRTVVNSGGMTTSWFGMKGSEDLGGGLKANFALTSFIQVDSGNAGPLCQRPVFLARCQRQPARRFWHGHAGPLAWRPTSCPR
jgi:predicted porin